MAPFSQHVSTVVGVARRLDCAILGVHCMGALNQSVVVCGKRSKGGEASAACARAHKVARIQTPVDRKHVLLHALVSVLSSRVEINMRC